MTTQYANKELREIAIKAKEIQAAVYINEKIQYITNALMKSAGKGDMKYEIDVRKEYVPQIVAGVKKTYPELSVICSDSRGEVIITFDWAS